MAKRRGRDGRAYRPWLVLAGFVTAIVNVLRLHRPDGCYLLAERKIWGHRSLWEK